MNLDHKQTGTGKKGKETQGGITEGVQVAAEF